MTFFFRPIVVDPVFFFYQRASKMRAKVAWVEFSSATSPHHEEWTIEVVGTSYSVV